MISFEEALKEAEEKLFEEPIIKEYFRLKTIIDNDKELQTLDKDMRAHQKKMCEFENDDKIYLKEKEAYERCLKDIENNPVYINFTEVKNEVNTLLKEVRNAIN